VVFKFLSAHMRYTIALPARFSQQPFLTAPLAGGRTWVTLGYTPAPTPEALAVPEGAVPDLEATVGGTAVTVFDLTPGKDLPNTPKYLLHWDLGAGIARMAIEAASTSRDDMLYALQNVQLASGGDGLPEMRLLGGFAVSPGLGTMTSEGAIFSGDASPVTFLFVAPGLGRARTFQRANSAVVRVHDGRGLGIGVEAWGPWSESTQVAGFAREIASSIAPA
jgi:hypothetical protein